MPKELPNLQEIPRERWAEVLRPLDQQERDRAARVSVDFFSEEGEAVWRLIAELMLEDADRRAAEPRVAVVPEPPAPATPLRPRQVNVKLSAAEHRRLVAMANTFALRPTQLARQLIVRGVAQLQDET